MLKKLLNFKKNNILDAKEREFLPAVLEIIESPPSPVGRVMLWSLTIFITLGVVWAMVGKVDEVSVAPGKLIPVGMVKTIQAEDKGVIKAIHVQDGQQVAKDQLLLELDPTISAADLERLKKDIAYYNLEIARLEAEKDNKPFTPPKDSNQNPQDVGFQALLYSKRMDEFKAKVSQAKAGIRQNQAMLSAAISARDKNAALYGFSQEKERRLRQLVEQNAIAYFELIDQQAKSKEYEQDLAASIAEIERVRHLEAQSREVLQDVLAENAKDITSKLVDDRKTLNSLLEEAKKAEEKNRLSSIVTPIEGRVTQLSVHTIGGVVTAAQPLMVVVPDNATLEVEAWLPNKDIGFVHINQHAEVKVETFNFQKFGTVGATVSEISADAVEDKEGHRNYRVVLKLDQDYILVDGTPQYLSPGMSVSSEIKTRKKRIIDFFLEPFKKYQSEGLRER